MQVQRLTIAALALILLLVDVHAPALAAESNYLVFASNGFSTPGYDISAIDITTGEISSIFTIESATSGIYPRDAKFVLSPDGRYLAYVLIWQSVTDVYKSESRYYVLDLHTGELLDIDVLGSTARSVTTAYPKPPSWSPDGSRLAVVAVHGQLGIFHISDGSLILLQPEPPTGFAPMWSSDSTLLAYEELNLYNQQVYIIPTDGSAPSKPLIAADTDRAAAHHLMGWVPGRHEVVIDRTIPFSTQSGQKLLRVNIESGQTLLMGEANPFAVSDVLSSGKVLVTNTPTLQVLDVLTGNFKSSIEIHSSLTVKIAPDQLHVVDLDTTKQETIVREYLLETGEQTATLTIPQPTSTLYWTPDQQNILFETMNGDSLTEINVFIMKADGSEAPRYLATYEGMRIGWANLNLT